MRVRRLRRLHGAPQGYPVLVWSPIWVQNPQWGGAFEQGEGDLNGSKDMVRRHGSTNGL